MRREDQRHRVGGDVRVEFGRNPTQQLDQLGLAQFLGRLAEALCLVESAGVPAGRRGVARVLVLGDTGDRPDALRQVDPLDLSEGPACALVKPGMLGADRQ